jgi:hypothetical protein
VSIDKGFRAVRRFHLYAEKHCAENDIANMGSLAGVIEEGLIIVKFLPAEPNAVRGGPVVTPGFERLNPQKYA